MKIGSIEIKGRAALAPMAGVTDAAFRQVCEGLGAAYTVSEMISAKAMEYNDKKTASLADITQDQGPVFLQIFGAEPLCMAHAAGKLARLNPAGLDINMGCPMPKIVRNGEGSALLEDMPLAERVISACVKSGKRISVKFRTGVTEERKIAAEFAKMCEGAGACMITVHGRTREKIYAGAPDYEQIAAAKRAVNIPVIANGGVWSKDDARTMLARTGADGVMIARAALYRPHVFCDLLGTQGEAIGTLFLRQLRETRALYGERFACVFMRKMAAFYVKGQKGASEHKRRLFAAQTSEEVETLAKEIFGA